jgi:transglutaminase-like putative cysteine protease
MKNYLEESYFFDYSNPQIQELVEPFRGLAEADQIKALFRHIRDHWRYNPFVIYTQAEHYRASFISVQEEGHCIDKSTLLIAAARALNIPARLRLAKVMNHIAVERLLQKLGTAHIAPHGIAELYVQGEWRKASTAFNKELCALYQVEPLEFDGSQDAVIQEYNQANDQFMEYVQDYGAFEDVPLAFIIDTFRSNYPELSKVMEGKTKIVL